MSSLIERKAYAILSIIQTLPFSRQRGSAPLCFIVVPRIMLSDIIKRQEENRKQDKGTTLADILGGEIMCANCFI